MTGFFSILAALIVFQGAANAELEVKGYVFGDYYYVASGADKDRNGFQIGRIYLTFDNKWNDKFSGRFRLEASDAGFGVDKKMTPVVKDVYLKYKKNGRSLVMGLSPTPTWGMTESVWGYRAIQKTFMDVNKLGSSRDTGVRFETFLGIQGKVKAQVMLGNGNSNKSEIDNDKKGYFRLDITPGKSLGLTLYADYESRPNDKDRTTLSAFAYKSGKDRAFAVETVWQKRKNATPGTAATAKGISVFGRSKTQEFGFVGRVDYFDPGNLASDDAETRVTIGVDLMPEPKIHIIPNVVIESFQDSAIETVITPRITLHFIF